MTDSAGTNMICPKCGKFQPSAETCAGCGVVIAKVRPEPAAPGADAADPAPTDITEPAREMSSQERTALAIAGVVVAALLVGAYFLFSPREMSIAEFVEAKKGTTHFRGFTIEGPVISTSKSGFLEIRSPDGRRLPSLKIGDDETYGYVTYDPREISYEPVAGDYVRVTGGFDRVPYVGMPGEYRQMTIAVAASIHVVKAGAGD